MGTPRASSLVGTAVWLIVACGSTPHAAPAPSAVDRCPGEDEDEDGFRDSDGCPDLDDDSDGIADVDDLCRCQAEDLDGFEDHDGCWDGDDDDDRIADDCDACPRDPETYNGCDDDDGCPDRGSVIVSDGRMVIVQHVYFERSAFDVPPRAFPILDAIAATLAGNPRITRIRITGHADASEPRPDRLGEKRAEAVRDYLIAHGIAPARLDVASAGATEPLAPSASIALRPRNRRVSFDILEIDGQPVSSGVDLPSVAPPSSSPCTRDWRSPCADPSPHPPPDACGAERAPP